MPAIVFGGHPTGNYSGWLVSKIVPKNQFGFEYSKIIPKARFVWVAFSLKKKKLASLFLSTLSPEESSMKLFSYIGSSSADKIPNLVE